MLKPSVMFHTRRVLGLAALCLIVAGCSGGTPLEFALSSINGAAFSPRKEDADRPVPNADVSAFQVSEGGHLTLIPLSRPLKTSGAGTFVVQDILPGQLVLVRVVGTVPAAQAAANPPVSVTALVHVPPAPAPGQAPPAVSTRVDLISDLAAAAALQLLERGELRLDQLTPAVIAALLVVARQVAADNCLLPGQDCTGTAGGTTPPTRDDLIQEVIQQARQTPGTLTPPDTGGVGVIVR